MAKSLLRVEWNGDEPAKVYIRSTGEHVATIYKNSGGSSYRYRLMSKPHKVSGVLERDACVARIEREVS